MKDQIGAALDETPSDTDGSLTLPSWTSRLVRSVLVQLLGGCLVLLASSSPALGWTPAFGYTSEASASPAPSPAVFGLFVAGLGLMLLGYWMNLRALRHTRPRLSHTLLVVMLLALPMVLLPTMPSSDLYSYAMYGRIDAIYDANPYTVTPRQFAEDPFFALASEKDAVSVYGPVWQVIARMIAGALGAGATPAAFAITYKLFGVAVLLVLATLIWAILRRLALQDQARGTWFFATNPLCLLELAGAGHNDGFMILFVLLAILAQLRGWTILAVVCIGLGVFTKWTIALVIPAYLVWAFAARGLRWKTTRDLAIGGLLVLSIGAGLYGRDLVGYANITAVTRNLQATVLNNSLAQWVALELELVGGQRQGTPPAAQEPVTGDAGQQGQTSVPAQAPISPIKWWVKLGFSLAFAVWALALLPRARSIRGLLYVWGWTLFAYLCLGSTWFWPWYVIWLVPLAALAPFTLLERATLILTATAHLITVARAARVAIPFNHRLDHAVLLIFLPPLAYVAISYLRGRRRQEAVAAVPMRAGSRR